ncbi:MAG: restriction endonuclease subunit S [Candidatus Cryptobacteroides sp.]
MEEWKEYRLGDVVRLINGRAYSQHELLVEGKYKIVRVGNLSGGDRWFYSNMELSEEKYCEKGDLLYAWACNFGPYIWKGNKTIYHYHIWKLIEDEKVVNKLFLFYYLKYLTPYWLGNVNGSVMVHITKDTMEKFHVSLPSLTTQQRIAAVLKSIDDKIELNRRINDNLDKAA